MVKKFYPIAHDTDELESIRNLVRDSVPTLEELNIPTEAFKEVKKHLDKCIEESSQKQNEVIKYVSQFFGKYIHIKFLYNRNFSKDRDTNPIWCCEFEYNALLYKYSEVNGYLFGVFVNLNDTYQGGCEDKGISFAGKINDYLIEIEEITKDEFIQSAQDSVNKCVNARIEKNNKRTLTENGYETD